MSKNTFATGTAASAAGPATSASSAAEQSGTAAAGRTTLDDLFAQKDLVILDGAMATELERKGLNLNDSLWSALVLIEQPEKIREVHYDYFVSGADCGTSASYQATIPGFLAKGYSEAEARTLIARSMEVLLAARDEWWEQEGKASGRPLPLAAAAIGPYGAYLADGSEYTGRYHLSEEEYQAFHRPRMEILKEAGADIFAIETLPRLEEAVACAKLAEELDSDYWLSFTFRNDHQISDGTTIAEIVQALGIGKAPALPHLKAIGVNCTQPAIVESIVRNLKAVTDLPVCVYPNRGETYDPVTKTWHGVANSKIYGALAKTWYRAGARLIGGCCRTRPEDIEQIAKWYAEEK